MVTNREQIAEKKQKEVQTLKGELEAAPRQPALSDGTAPDELALGLPPQWLFGLGLLLLILPIFAGLHMDDYTNIYNAKQADWSLYSLGTSFFHGAGASQDGYLPKGYERPVAYYFRPLLVALFKVEYELFGLRDWLFHLTNVIFHLLNLLLLYLVGKQITGSERVSQWAVILMMFHTPSFAAVAWVSGRTEVCVATVLLLTVFFYGRFRNSGLLHHFFLAFFFCVIALGCKEQSVVFPLLLFAWDRLVHREKRFTPWPLPFFIPVVAIVFYRTTLPGVSELPPASFYFHPPGTEGFVIHAFGRFCESILALVQLLSHTIIPYGMMVSLPTIMALVAASGAIVWALWSVVGDAKAAPFLAYWIALFTAPTCMCTQLPLYLYIPTLGAVLLFAHLIGPPPRGPASILLRLRHYMLILWIVVGTVMAIGTSTWLHKKHSQQGQLVKRVVQDSNSVKGPLRVHIFGSSVPMSAIRAYIRLALPKRLPAVHHMTLSSLFLQPRPIDVQWVKLTSQEAGSRLIVKEGKRHPFKNWIFGHLHEKPITFTVGDHVSTADYTMTLKRSAGKYYWDIYFKSPVLPSWLFYVLLPNNKVLRLDSSQFPQDTRRKTRKR